MPLERKRTQPVFISMLPILLLTLHPACVFATLAEEESQAMQWNVTYKATALDALSGQGEDQLGYHGNIDLTLDLDMEKMLGWQGNHLFAYVLNNHGNQLSDYVQGNHGIDNIEVEEPTTKLYQLWMKQQFLDGKHSLLAGLYDLNSEFYVTDSSGLFIGPPFGIGTEMSGAGQNGPSIFPTTSVGLRVRVTPADHFYLQALMADGVPGDLDNPNGTHVHFKSSEGWLWVTEAGRLLGDEENPSGKIALGAWRYSENFDHLSETDSAGNPLQEKSEGVYFLLEQQLWQDETAPTGFLRYGHAAPDVNAVEHAMEIGFSCTGCGFARSQDAWGLGIAWDQQGDATKTAAQTAGEPIPDEDWLVELTYQANLTEWLAMQPVVEYLQQDGNFKDTWIAGLRIQLSY